MNNKLFVGPSKKPVITEKDTGIWRRFINKKYYCLFHKCYMDKLKKKKCIKLLKHGRKKICKHLLILTLEDVNEL